MPVFLLLHKCYQAILFNKQAVFYKTYSISSVIAFLKVFDFLARILATFIAIRNSFFFNTVFNLTLTTMFRFPFVAFQTTGTRLFYIAVFVAYHTIHPTRSKHN